MGIPSSHPQREKDYGAAESQYSILPANSSNILENINIVVNHSSMGVALVSRVYAQAKQAFPLPASNREGSSRGEPSYDWNRDEVNQETKSEKSTEQDDQSRKKGEENSILGSILSVGVCHESHDSRRTDGDVFSTAKDTVGKAAHESRVQPVLRR